MSGTGPKGTGRNGIGRNGAGCNGTGPGGAGPNGTSGEEPPDDGFMLLEGWMFGALMFPPAMEVVSRLPPANDNTAG